jgi:hypothetical protein
MTRRRAAERFVRLIGDSDEFATEAKNIII